MATLRSDEASVYNEKNLGENNRRYPHRTSRATASTLRGPLFKYLTDELLQLLEYVPVSTRQTMWFVHNEAPDHFTRDIKQLFSTQIDR
jgi:hypothetical protein